MLEILNLLFRAKKLIITTFLVVLVPLLTFVAITPNKYEAHMSFLITNERADPLISSDPHQNAIQHGDITEEDLNSEVEILSSTELLQAVVKACGLQSEFEGRFHRSEGAAVERATRKLTKNLTITPVRKSALINVSYRSSDRERSKRVLNELGALYLQQHARLHAGGASAGVFREQGSMIEGKLLDEEKQRAAFLEQSGYTLLPEQKQLMVQQMLEVMKARDEVGATLAETDSRLRKVDSQRQAIPLRIVTQDRTSANQYSVERLNTMLAELQNRRTELATKFRSDDRFVTEVDREIADTQSSLARAEQIHSNDETTDVNPLRQNLDAEADHLIQTRAGLLSRRTDLDNQLALKRTDLAKIERAGVYIDDLNRQIRESETSLDLYRTKAIAAGIADDLDKAKISNVLIAASPLAPVLPVSSSLNSFTSLLLAFFISLAVGLYSEMHSNRLYGPAALEAATGLPVLATLSSSSVL